MNYKTTLLLIISVSSAFAVDYPEPSIAPTETPVDYPQSTNVAPVSPTETPVDYPQSTDVAPVSLTETPVDYPTMTPIDYPMPSSTETHIDYPMPSVDVPETLPEPQLDYPELEPNQNATKPPYGYVPSAPPSSFDENGSRMNGAVTMTAVMIGFVLLFT